MCSWQESQMVGQSPAIGCGLLLMLLPCLERRRKWPQAQRIANARAPRQCHDWRVDPRAHYPA